MNVVGSALFCMRYKKVKLLFGIQGFVQTPNDFIEIAL